MDGHEIRDLASAPSGRAFPSGVRSKVMSSETFERGMLEGHEIRDLPGRGGGGSKVTRFETFSPGLVKVWRFETFRIEGHEIRDLPWGAGMVTRFETIVRPQARER